MLKIDGYTQAYLVNRYLAYSMATKFLPRFSYKKVGKKYERYQKSWIEREGYEIQWQSIKNDCLGIFRNPFQLVPQIAYSLLAFWFIFRGDHEMAKLVAFSGVITVNGNANGTTNGAGPLTFTSHTVGGSNRLMLIGYSTASGELASSVKFNTVTAGSMANNTAQVLSAMHRLINPDTGANTVEVTLVSGTIIMAGEISFTDADQTQTGAATVNGSFSAATSTTRDLTTTVDNSFVVDLIVHDEPEDTVPGQGTEYVSVNNPGSNYNFSQHYIQKVTAGAQTMSWSWTTSSIGCHVAVEVIEGIAAAVTTNPRRMMMGIGT